jgi:hypothetical protein
MDQKIDFLIIGAQKCGTTTLDHYLRQHTEIGMGNHKELHFFDDEALFSNPIIDYKHFTNQFNFSTQKKIYGESTPIYIYWKPCLERIYRYNKNIKLILILRNPIERAFSHWNMEFERNAEKENFSHAIHQETQRLKSSPLFQHRVYSYIDRGFYNRQVKQLLHYFDPKQLFILKYESFFNDEERQLYKLFDFLGVSHAYDFKPAKLNKREYQASIRLEEKEHLIKLFENDITELENTLGWNCSDWKTRNN